MYTFTDEIKIIGINPYVSIPDDILAKLFEDAEKNKGPIPISGKLNGRPYKQTLMKYSGEWRLYVNTMMLTNSPKRIGEKVEIAVAYDPKSRSIEPHPKFVEALSENPAAREVFEELSPSRKHEIVRYINNLKSEATVDINIIRAIDFLTGKGRFVGRDKP